MGDSLKSCISGKTKYFEDTDLKKKKATLMDCIS